MGFEVLSGTCTGRGFADVDADGFLKNLHDFVTGHADWDIILDRSTLPVQDTCTDSDSGTDIITCAGHGFKNGEIVRFQDLGNGVPGGIGTTTDYFVGVENANEFKIFTSRQRLHSDTVQGIGDLALNFGVTRMEPYILISNDGIPSDANDLKNMLKWGYHTQEGSYARCQWVGSYDSVTEEIVFIWDGVKISTLDAASFVFNIRANDNGLFYGQTQVSGAWRGCGTDEFSPLANYLESLAILGTAQTALANGADVVVQVTNSVEADTFTKNEWYYIYDFRYDAVIPRIAVAYGECTGVGVADGLNADEIQFGTLNNDFNSGAKISPYPLPVVSIDNGAIDGDPGEDDFRDGGTPTKIPFYGRSDGATGFFCIYDQTGDIQGAYRISREQNAILIAAPDDKGNYTVQRPLVCEYLIPNSVSVTTQMNRPYGECKNVFSCDNNLISIMVSGRTINTKEHIDVSREDLMFSGGTSSIHVLMINEA